MTPHPVPEAGSTLIEAATVLATMLVILATLLGILQSLTTSDRRVQALTTNEEAVRFALDQMARDLRAANPVDVFASTSSYNNQIQVELGPNPGTRQYIRWAYDAVPGSHTYEFLFRQVMSGPSANATVQSQAAMAVRVHNSETGTPVFRYYDSHGTDLVTASALTPADVANCAIHVHVQVNSDADPGPQPFSENVDVELRNRLPGGIVGCAS